MAAYCVVSCQKYGSTPIYFFCLLLHVFFFCSFFLHCGHETDMYINKRYDRSNSELLIYKNDNKNI